jgi:hypothetical protein
MIAARPAGALRDRDKRRSFGDRRIGVGRSSRQRAEAMQKLPGWRFICRGVINRVRIAAGLTGRYRIGH